MGAYSYCQKCGSGNPMPTFSEAVKRKAECACGEDRELSDWHFEDALVFHYDNLVERVEALEKMFVGDGK